jgi:hypothetical protein
VQPWSRSHRKRRNILWRLRWSQEKCGALACHRFRHSNHPANLRRAAKTHLHFARLRRNRDRAYPRVCLAMVSGWRALVSRNCAPETQTPKVLIDKKELGFFHFQLESMRLPRVFLKHFPRSSCTGDDAASAVPKRPHPAPWRKTMSAP